eukprot:125108_1
MAQRNMNLASHEPITHLPPYTKSELRGKTKPVLEVMAEARSCGPPENESWYKHQFVTSLHKWSIQPQNQNFGRIPNFDEIEVPVDNSAPVDSIFVGDAPDEPAPIQPDPIDEARMLQQLVAASQQMYRPPPIFNNYNDNHNRNIPDEDGSESDEKIELLGSEDGSGDNGGSDDNGGPADDGGIGEDPVADNPINEFNQLQEFLNNIPNFSQNGKLIIVEQNGFMNMVEIRDINEDKWCDRVGLAYPDAHRIANALKIYNNAGQQGDIVQPGGGGDPAEDQAEGGGDEKKQEEKKDDWTWIEIGNSGRYGYTGDVTDGERHLAFKHAIDVCVNVCRDKYVDITSFTHVVGNNMRRAVYAKVRHEYKNGRFVCPAVNQTYHSLNFLAKYYVAELTNDVFTLIGRGGSSNYTGHAQIFTLVRGWDSCNVQEQTEMVADFNGRFRDDPTLRWSKFASDTNVLYAVNCIGLIGDRVPHPGWSAVQHVQDYESARPVGRMPARHGDDNDDDDNDDNDNIEDID